MGVNTGTSSGGSSSSVGPVAALTIGGSAPNNTATGVFTCTGIELGDDTNTNPFAASAVTTALFTLNGGVADIGGNITNNSTQGTTVSTLTLAGGTLNMMGNTIGNNGGINSGNGPVNVVFPAVGQSATLENLGGSGINGANGLDMNGGGTLILAGSNTFTGTTAVDSGTLVVSALSAIPANGTVTAGTSSTNGIFQLARGVGAVTLTSLTVSTGSTADLTNNPLFINYTGAPDPIATIVSYLTSGYDAPGGHWTGGQIDSSSVAAMNATQSKLIYSIGYSDGADGLDPSLSSGEIEILPTLAGDAKLQGDVVFGDFQVLAQYFGKSGTNWEEGNFTYGSTTNFGDFQVLAQDFGQGSGGLTSAEAASLNNFAEEFGYTLVANSNGVGFQIVSVPEPASVGLLAAAGLGLLARRRRKDARR